jgi:Domain of unknown function (DUF4158)/Tn3 transposase DDE domain
MPVDFLTFEQKDSYGKFSGEPNEVQLARYFHLDEIDLKFINNRRGDHNRFGVALQLSCVRFLGTFLTNLSQVPTKAQWFIASQLDIIDISVLVMYADRETTHREHTALIRNQYQYLDFGWPWSFRLTRLLFARSWTGNERPSILFDLATSWLIQHKVLLPGHTTLMRLISEVRDRSVNRLWRLLSKLPTVDQVTKLETLFHVPDESRTSLLDQFRKGPVTISSLSLNQAVERYQKLKDFGMKGLNFSSIPPIQLKNVARYASMLSVYKIARMSIQKRTAILVAFVRAYEIMALDDALDVLDWLIADISSSAKRLGEQKRIRTLKDLDKSALNLAEVCTLILNENLIDEQIRPIIFERVSREKLVESVLKIHELVRPHGDYLQDEMIAQYGRVRRFLPKLLSSIEFKAGPAGASTLEALQYLANLFVFRQKSFDDAPIGIVSNRWKRLVFEGDGKINKQGYTLCFLDKLQDSLRRRDIYVQESDRWGDPRAKLLHGQEWISNRIQVCRSLGHSMNPTEAVEGIVQQLDSTYREVSASFNDNRSVRLDLSGKRPVLTISNLDKLPESPSLTRLAQQVESMLPSVDLTELLLEINAHTGFADEFVHVSEANSRAEELTTSICAVLLSEACNIGLEPLIKHQVPALTRHRLNWIKQNYLRSETLVRANAKLVDYQSTLSLANKWGGGEVASADGMRFVAPIRTIHAGPNRKYLLSQEH